MKRYQRAQRLAFWRGLAIALFVFTSFIVALGLADAMTGH